MLPGGLPTALKTVNKPYASASGNKVEKARFKLLVYSRDGVCFRFYGKLALGTRRRIEMASN